MFHSSTSFSMDLGCPLLRGSSVRRLCRRAATTSNKVPGFNTIKKHGSHRKSYMVIYENIKVIENATEVYGNMQVIKKTIM